MKKVFLAFAFIAALLVTSCNKKVETTTYNNYPFIVFNVHRKGTNRVKQTFFAKYQ